MREEPGQKDDWPRHAFLEQDLERLERQLAPYSLSFSDETRERILKFSRDLISWNDRLNLLSRADAPNVVRKHVAASIGVLLVAVPSHGEKWIDVGTGAGFPGLILKMMRPDLDITLVDSARKRCLFIENTIRTTDLGKVPVLPLRVETFIARGEGLGSFAVLTARAVASLDATLAGFGPLVSPGGRIVTFKGPQWKEELEAAQASGAFASAGFTFEAATRIPWTSGHLLTLRKALTS